MNDILYSYVRLHFNLDQLRQIPSLNTHSSTENSAKSLYNLTIFARNLDATMKEDHEKKVPNKKKKMCSNINLKDN